METFSIEAMVRGYHVYQDIWNATVGHCQREIFFPRSTIFADGGLFAKTTKIVPRKFGAIQYVLQCSPILHVLSVACYTSDSMCYSFLTR